MPGNASADPGLILTPTPTPTRCSVKAVQYCLVVVVKIGFNRFQSADSLTTGYSFSHSETNTATCVHFFWVFLNLDDVWGPTPLVSHVGVPILELGVFDPRRQSYRSCPSLQHFTCSRRAGSDLALERWRVTANEIVSARGCFPSMLPPNHCRRVCHIPGSYFLPIGIKWFPDIHRSERERARDPEGCICKLATRTDAELIDAQSDPGPRSRFTAKAYRLPNPKATELVGGDPTSSSPRNLLGSNLSGS
jgi:hypothetical protein